MADGCIFCKIASGEVPTDIAYENERAIAFDDMSPMMPVHVLVIPKEHHEDIADGIPAETLADMIDAANEVAKARGIDSTGYRVLTNKGDDARQSVHHVHLHVLGGDRMNDGDPSIQ